MIPVDGKRQRPNQRRRGQGVAKRGGRAWGLLIKRALVWTIDEAVRVPIMNTVAGRIQCPQMRVYALEGLVRQTRRYADPPS